MSQDPQQRLAWLESSCRRWRWLALAGWVALLAALAAWLAVTAQHRAASRAYDDLLQERAAESEDRLRQNDRKWREEVRKILEQQDIKALQGTWALQWSIGPEFTLPEGVISIIFTGNDYAFRAMPGVVIGEAVLCGQTAVTLDPTTKPKSIDCRYEKCDEVQLGIYELQGDRLRICWGEKRPTAFSTDNGAQLWTLRRLPEIELGGFGAGFGGSGFGGMSRGTRGKGKP